MLAHVSLLKEKKCRSFLMFFFSDLRNWCFHRTKLYRCGAPSGAKGPGTYGTASQGQANDLIGDALREGSAENLIV